MSDELAAVLALTETGRGDGRIGYRTSIGPVFTIGPKVHGGSLQMVVAHAARSALAALGDDTAKIPVAISSDYLYAPDAAEVDLEVTIRKSGRTVTVLSVDAVQGGRTMVASAVTMARADQGAARYSAMAVFDGMAAEPPATGLRLEDSPIAEVNHLSPVLDMVVDPVAFPVLRGETGDPVVRGWIRPKGREPDADFAVLVADISPPVVMNLGLFGWAPTVQLTTYVRRHPEAGWLRFAATSAEIGQGMFEEDHTVIDSAGSVVAQSRQLALIPQKPPAAQSGR